MWFSSYASEQTDRQTNKQTYSSNTSYLSLGEVTSTTKHHRAAAWSYSFPARNDKGWRDAKREERRYTVKETGNRGRGMGGHKK